MRVTANSKCGHNHQYNEDRTAVFELDNNRSVFILTDGVGGFVHGEKAAQCAIDRIGKYFEKDFRNENPVSALATVMDLADLQIEILRRQLKCKLGTTIALGILIENDFHFTWQGNVRIYHHDHSDLKWCQLTQDHVLPTGYGDFRITRCLKGEGLRDDLPIYHIKVSHGDHILFCTDGFHKKIPQMVEPIKINATFTNTEPEDDATYILISI